MALAAVAQGALRVGALLGKSAMGVTKAAGSAVKSGISSGAKNVNKQVKKAILKRKKIKRDTFIGKQRSKKKEQEKNKRKLKEQELERKNTSKSGPGVGNVAKKALNPLQALIQFLTTILIGWVANKLPQIIEWAEGLIKKIREIVELIKSLFANITGFFTGVKDLIVGVFDAVKNLDFSDKEGNIKSALEKIKESFGGVLKDIGDGFNILKRKENENPKDILKKQPEDVTDERSHSELKPPPNSGGLSSASTPLTPMVSSGKNNPGGGPMDATLSGSAAQLIGNDTEFLAEVKRVSRKFGAREGDLLGLMASESRFNPAADNGTHVGLIQFSRDSARAIGTTQAALKGMTRAQQMKYVEKYFQYWKDAGYFPDNPTAAQLYTVVFAPAYSNKQDHEALYIRGSAAYAGNAPLDTNNDGKITMAEMGQRIQRKKQEFGISDTGLAPSTSPTTISPQPQPQPQIQSAPRMAQLDIDRQGQDIVVVDDQPTPQQPSGVPGQQSSPQPIIVQPSLNSMLRQQLLLDLAYT
jgi:hypothetical protein